MIRIPLPNNDEEILVADLGKVLVTKEYSYEALCHCHYVYYNDKKFHISKETYEWLATGEHVIVNSQSIE